ncbi:MAG: serpin family protein [Bacillota bacterium]
MADGVRFLDSAAFWSGFSRLIGRVDPACGRSLARLGVPGDSLLWEEAVELIGAVKFLSGLKRTAYFQYAQTDRLQIVELPYRGDEIVMDILLPTFEPDRGELEPGLQLPQFQSLLDQLAMTKVEVFLPRFKMEKEITLNSHLQSLGMKDAFDDAKADFSGIAQFSFYITHVLHKAFVGVNETGTEAAAATGIIMGETAIQSDKPVVFRADHPFFFVIRDRHSGSILFMGRVVDPL